jgi:6-phosphogluconolactonase (cycloisomerase 2 family)
MRDGRRGITAFTRDPVSGSVGTDVGHRLPGGAPCYVMVDHAGGHLLLANYPGNVAVFRSRPTAP